MLTRSSRARVRRSVLFAAPGVAALLTVAVLLDSAADPAAPSVPRSGEAAPATEHPPSTDADAVRVDMIIHVMQGSDWHLISQNAAPGILVLHVRIERLDSVEAAARDIVRRLESPYDEVLVYFYLPTSDAAASRRVQWTPATGYRTLIYGSPAASD